LTRRTRLYVLIYFLAPFIFIVLLLAILLTAVISAFSVLMLMVMAPFYWLFSKLTLKSHFSLTRWRRLGGRMFEYSRKVFIWLAGESPLHEMEPLNQEPEKK